MALFSSRAVSSGGPKTFGLVHRKSDKKVKISPGIKQELKRNMPTYDLDKLRGTMSDDAGPLMATQYSPDTFIKNMDSTFENFFY